MRILFLLDDFPPLSYSGPSIVASNFAQELLKRGHEVFIITSVQDKSQAGKDEYNGLKIFRFFSNYPYRWSAYLSLYNPQLVSEVRGAIREIKPDVCHFHHIHRYLSYHCFKVAKKYCPAVFLTAHDVMLVHYGKLIPKEGKCVYKVSIKDQINYAKKRFNPFRNRLISYYLKYIDQIFSISHSLQDFLKINGIKNEIETIYNGININDWQTTSEDVKAFKIKYNLAGKKIILFGGRLSGAKGGDVIIEAMVEIVKKFKEAVLLIAGEKDQYAKKMADLAKELKIQDNLVFSGWLKREEMKLAFFACDICVTPSIYCDPFNLFNIEAMAAKKPVVGTCFGGTPEIVLDNNTGFIVNPLNPSELAKKILPLLADESLATKFGNNGIMRVKEYFSTEKLTTKLLAAYSKVLNKNEK